MTVELRTIEIKQHAEVITTYEISRDIIISSMEDYYLDNSRFTVEEIEENKKYIDHMRHSNNDGDIFELKDWLKNNMNWGEVVVNLKEVRKSFKIKEIS